MFVYFCDYSVVRSGEKQAAFVGWKDRPIKLLAVPDYKFPLTGTNLVIPDQSATGNGLFGNSTLTIGNCATGYVGGTEYTDTVAIEPPARYTSPRHLQGSNILAFDGRVKWLMGAQVSPGYTFGTFAPTRFNHQTSAWYEDYANTMPFRPAA